MFEHTIGVPDELQCHFWVSYLRINYCNHVCRVRWNAVPFLFILKTLFYPSPLFLSDSYRFR
jgi:hypothetical protein